MKIYTTQQVAQLLQLKDKAVLGLIKRGFLKVLPGIRHKRITDEELQRYLDIRRVLESAAPITPALRGGPGQAVAHPTGHSARPSIGAGATQGHIVVNHNGEGRGAAFRALKPKGNQ